MSEFEVTITHNRACGQHLLEPMKAIVKKLLDEGNIMAPMSRPRAINFA